MAEITLAQNAPPPIAEPKPMSPKPQPLDLRQEHRMELPHLVARERRMKTFESIMGADENGQPRIGQVLREGIINRIAKPIDTKYTMSPQTSRTFLELHDAQAEIQRIYEDDKQHPKDRAELAKLLATQLAPVYQRRPGGLEELRELSDDQIMKDAFDFPATATRELFLGKYLEHQGDEQDARRKIVNTCFHTPEGDPLDKKALKSGIKDAVKFETKSIRELGKLAHTLGFTSEEQAALGPALQVGANLGELPLPPSADRSLEGAVARQYSLIKDSIRNITGNTQDPELESANVPQLADSPKYRETYMRVTDKADLYEQLSLTITHMQDMRRVLAFAAQEVPGGVLKEAFAEYRKGEQKMNGLKKSISALEKGIRRRFRLIGVRKQGIDRLLERDTNLVADTVRQFGEEVKTVSTDGQVTPSTEELVALAQRPYESLAKGVDRIESWAENRADGHVDKVVALGKTTPDDVELQDGRVVKKEPAGAVVKQGGEDTEDVIAQEAKAAVAKLEVVEQTPDTAAQIQQEMEERVANDPKLVEKIAEVVQGPKVEPSEQPEAGEKAAESNDPLRLVVELDSKNADGKKAESQNNISKEDQERQRSELEQFAMYRQAYLTGIEALKQKKSDPKAAEAVKVAEEYMMPFFERYGPLVAQAGLGTTIARLYLMPMKYEAPDGTVKEFDHNHFETVTQALKEEAQEQGMNSEEAFYFDSMQNINTFMADIRAHPANYFPQGGEQEELKAA